MEVQKLEDTKNVANEKQKAKKGRKVTIRYKRFDRSLPALHREYGNAGFDLFARLDKPVTINPGETAVIPLNIATEIPPYAVGLLFQRSSTFRKWGVALTNGVGVIDSSFRGNLDEWGAEFINLTNEPKTINPGDKLCQAVFVPLLPVRLVEVGKLGGRNRGGFGTSADNARDVKGEK